MKTTEGKDAHNYSGCMLGVFAGHLLTDELMDEIKKTMDKMKVSNRLKDESKNNISHMKSRTGLWLRCYDGNDVFHPKKTPFENGWHKIIDVCGKVLASYEPYKPKKGDFVYMEELFGSCSFLYVGGNTEGQNNHIYALTNQGVSEVDRLCDDDLIAAIRPATEEEKQTLIKAVEEKYHKTYNEDTKKWEDVKNTIDENKETYNYPAHFRALANSISDLYERKNKDYSNSFSDTYKELGEVSAITRMSDKMNRVVQLSKSEAQVKDESKIDTLKDLASYALMYIMELEGDGTNGSGK